METNPAFIHIEASSTQEPSFPAEIYWGIIQNKESIGYLINPEEVASWVSYRKDFYDIHQITETELLAYGNNPAIVCREINQFLDGKTAYAKNSLRTTRLLTELFSGADIQPANFTIFDLEELFLETLKKKTTEAESSELVLAQIKEKVAEEQPHYVCGGAFEALYYAEIWKRIYA